ncbi:TPA: hypothetical protein RG501_RS07970 [Providencia rettgeri]|nr:hypothetical protein [Providencia rettgeri]
MKTPIYQCIATCCLPEETTTHRQQTEHFTNRAIESNPILPIPQYLLCSWQQIANKLNCRKAESIPLRKISLKTYIFAQVTNLIKPEFSVWDQDDLCI